MKPDTRGCGPKKGSCDSPGKPRRELHTLQALVKWFHRRIDTGADFRFFRKLKPWNAVLEHAGMAMDQCGKRFPHQYRLKKAALKAATRRLHRADLKSCKDFDALFDAIEMLELPKSMQSLTPSQAEDFLCICKDDLWRIAR